MLEALASGTRQQKGIKDIQVGEEKGKLSSFTNNMISDRKYDEIYKKLLELVGKFGKDAGYKINIHKFLKNFYTLETIRY